MYRDDSLERVKRLATVTGALAPPSDIFHTATVYIFSLRCHHWRHRHHRAGARPCAHAAVKSAAAARSPPRSSGRS
jgi:hypothetical protein